MKAASCAAARSMRSRGQLRGRCRAHACCPTSRPSDARPRGARAAAGRLEADRVRAVWDGRRRPRRAQGWIRTAKTILTGLGGKCSSYLLLEATSSMDACVPCEDDARSEPNLGGFAKWYRNRLHLDLGGQLFHKVPTSHSTRNTDQTGARALCCHRTVSQFYFTEAPAHSCPLGKQTSVYRVTVSRYCTIPGARARARRQAPHSCGKTDATMRDADLLKMPDAKVKNRTTTLNNDS